VKIVGHTNVPGRLAATASSLYARNLYAFVETLVDKETKALAINWDDELVKATNLTRDGSVVHASFQSKTDGPASEAAALGLAKSETGKAEAAPAPSGAH
jgi:NAD(P) transhydrogenase subunit alpha